MSLRPSTTLGILGAVMVLAIAAVMWVGGLRAQVYSSSRANWPAQTSSDSSSRHATSPYSSPDPEPWPHRPGAPSEQRAPTPVATRPLERARQVSQQQVRPSAASQSKRVNTAVYYRTAIAPRGRVTANQWSGPRSQPVRPIQRVNYEFEQSGQEAGAVPAESLLVPFEQRAALYPRSSELPAAVNGSIAELPTDYAPWWDVIVNKPVSEDRRSLAVNVESLIMKALEHSPQVTALKIDPLIRETAVLEEYAAFDWTAFVESTFDRTSDPVGNALTVGPGATRFRDNNLSHRGGLRKRFDQGLEFDVSQRVGHQDNNSQFLVPNPQGTARLEVNFRQPLMRGAGQTVNQSRVVLAMIDRNVSDRELIERLQTHLVGVYQAYWSLYRARAIRLQKLRLLDRATKILALLEARQGIDSLRRQVLRARAAVASRRSEIVRADMAIRNAESQLRLLVNSPELKQGPRLELLPAELPMSESLDISLRGSIETALRHRPDVAAAIQKMKAESLRLGVARNDLLPKLDFVLGTYVAGLRGSGEIDGALRRQFTEGEPGYTVGIVFEYPLGNRAAKARAERSEWELARSLKEFEATVETGMTEVELAVRALNTAYQEMLSRFQSMLAAETEANYLMERWQHLPGADQTTSFLLEDLLDAQERVATEEADFTGAQVDYVLALVGLKEAAGILLSCEDESNVFSAAALEDSTDQLPVYLPEPVPAGQ